jgi:beta-N-acetylhexosaminidase
MSLRWTAALAAAVVLGLTTAAPQGPAQASSPPSSLSLETTAAVPTPAQQLAKLTLDQRIGQVVMGGVPATGASSSDLAMIKRYHMGNIFLSGRSSKGVAATRKVTDALRATVSSRSTGGTPLFIATDQEGGYVQVLSGPGFETIPTALHQGRWLPRSVQVSAQRWGGQLRSAGVNVNLAPVADTVPASIGTYNLPIGYWNREFGNTPEHVAADVVAFSKGMKASGVAPVIKHFPGLGRVHLNTDISRGVTDTVTTRRDAYLRPFKDGIGAGARWVMVSNAYYSKIDARHIGPFSPTIMRTMLRTDLGFTGIVISDDLCNAAQLSPWSHSTRARAFFNAGGTMLLCTDARDLPAMQRYMHDYALAHPAFRAKIDAAALKVLEVKHAGA